MSISAEIQLTNTPPCTPDPDGLFVEPRVSSPLLRPAKPAVTTDPIGVDDMPSSFEDLLGWGIQVATPVVFEP